MRIPQKNKTKLTPRFLKDRKLELMTSQIQFKQKGNDMSRNDAAEQKRIFAEEAAVVNAQVLLHGIMDRRGITRADLARAMNVSRARITQIFSDECSNFTIRLLARAIYALEEELVFEVAKDFSHDAADGECLMANLLNPDEKTLWVEITDYSRGVFVADTANDNIFGGLAEMRSGREQYEELAA